MEPDRSHEAGNGRIDTAGKRIAGTLRDRLWGRDPLRGYASAQDLLRAVNRATRWARANYRAGRQPPSHIRAKLELAREVMSGRLKVQEA